jgi:hypothetical protein
VDFADVDAKFENFVVRLIEQHENLLDKLLILGLYTLTRVRCNKSEVLHNSVIQFCQIHAELSTVSGELTESPSRRRLYKITSRSIKCVDKNINEDI